MGVRRTEWDCTLGRVVSEVASGLNDRRPNLRRLLSDPRVGTILVEHRDRLARFGVGMVDAMLEARGGSLRVVEDKEVDDDLVPGHDRDTDVLLRAALRSAQRRQSGSEDAVSAASRRNRAAWSRLAPNSAPPALMVG